MSHAPDLTSIIEASPRKVPTKFIWICLTMISIGIAGGHWGFANDRPRAMAAFLFNLVYFLGMCQGAFMLAVALTLTLGRWGRPLKRIAEAFALFIPFLYAVLILFLLTGGLEIFPWMHEEVPAHKNIWLQPRFFVIRQIVELGFMIVLSILYLRASWRPDLFVMSQRLGNAAPAWWRKWTENWTNLEDEVATSERRQRVLGVIIAISYSIIFSLVAVDLEMSLAPHWFANMFPAWFFMSCFWLGLVAVAIYSIFARDWLGITHLLTGKVYHDLGKLTLGLCMFWGYTTYAQYLAIWYGNIPEETGFIMLRTQMDPWASVAQVVLLCCFLIPFPMLLSRGLKKTTSGYLAVGTVIAIGLWLERYLVIMPSVSHDTTLPLGFSEVAMGIGFLGGVILIVSCVLAAIPPVPITDELMAPHPDDVHVHPSNAHAH